MNERTVSVAWLLAELAGMSFPNQGQAHDYIKKAIEQPKMRLGLDLMKERAAAKGIELPEGEDASIPSDLFVRLGLPLIVRCRGCEMTMCVAGALIGPDSFTYCADCAEDRAPVSLKPGFSHAELRVIWDALQQYCDNHDGTEETRVPPEATAALGKLDAYHASFAEMSS